MPGVIRTVEELAILPSWLSSLLSKTPFHPQIENGKKGRESTGDERELKILLGSA